MGSESPRRARARAGAARGARCFPTSIGPCAIAWSDVGVCGVALPARDERATLRRLRAQLGGARLDLEASLPVPQALVIGRLRAHLDGRPDDLRSAALDLRACTPRARLTYEALREIWPGETISYAGLAARCGTPRAARSIGQAMGANPVPLIVPCHRVVAADGPGGFGTGLATKLRLLTLEGADLAPFWRAAPRELRRRDERLAPVIRRVGPCRLEERQRGSYFGALATAIVHQQVSMAVGRTIRGRLAARCGVDGDLAPRAVLDASAEDLRAVGLSRQKITYLKDLADHVLGDAAGFAALTRQHDEQVIARLTAIKGIGRWTAEMFLMFRLGRLDVLPVADLGLQQAVRKLYGVRRPTPERITKLAAAWVPYRSVATWYLWRSLEAGGL